MGIYYFSGIIQLNKIRYIANQIHYQAISEHPFKTEKNDISFLLLQKEETQHSRLRNRFPCPFSMLFSVAYNVVCSTPTGVLRRMSSRNNPARIAIVMGSKSDWATMQFATEVLDILNVPHHVEVVSAHRTPDKLFSFAESAEENGYQVIIAGAGGAAHLPGMIAAKTLVPVLGVPVQSAALSGVDSLYSIVQMPRGIPVGTLAIGKAGAANAALLAAQILAQHDAELHQRLAEWRRAQTDEVLENPDPRGDA